LLRLSEVLHEAGEVEKSDAFSSAALAIGRETGDKKLESLAGELQSSVRTNNQGQ
jgi:hypothetical protein